MEHSKMPQPIFDGSFETLTSKPMTKKQDPASAQPRAGDHDSFEDGHYSPASFMNDPITVLGVLSTAHKYPASYGLPHTTPYIREMEIPVEIAWHGILPLTARLGLPLKHNLVLESSTDNGLSIEEIKAVNDIGLIESAHNPVYQHFSAVKSLRKDDIAFKDDIPGHERPSIMLVRFDGQDLRKEHVQAMWRFVDKELFNAVNHPEHFHSFFAKMTPENFVAFYNTYPENGGLECPVTLGCKKCGKEAGRLMRYGKCGVVKYCDRECQKEDWKLHKQVCFKM